VAHTREDIPVRFLSEIVPLGAHSYPIPVKDAPKLTAWKSCIYLIRSDFSSATSTIFAPVLIITGFVEQVISGREPFDSPAAHGRHFFVWRICARP
jgi:hypothetical protein